MNERLFNTAVNISHLLLRQILCHGDTVVDATCGNGHDTVMLAYLIGEEGHVYGFDIQEQAIKNTRDKLASEGLEKRVSLFHCGHELIKEQVPRPVKAIIFNLGYLPGGNHLVITQKDTTIQAIKDGLDILSIGGVIILVLYPGHPGGEDEMNAVIDFTKCLSKQEWDVINIKHLNRKMGAPRLLVLQKIK